MPRHGCLSQPRYSHSWTGLVILPSQQLRRRLAINTTFTYPLDRAADTPADEPARKPCRNRGSTGGCRQATTSSPWGTIRPGAPRVKWLGRVGFSREIKALHPQILDSPLDPFWLDWLPNRLDRSYVPCLSLSKNHKSWQYYAAGGPGQDASKLGDSANANGGRLGWRKGAHPEPGAVQSRAQDANLHDTRFGGP